MDAWHMGAFMRGVTHERHTFGEKARFLSVLGPSIGTCHFNAREVHTASSAMKYTDCTASYRGLPSVPRQKLTYGLHSYGSYGIYGRRFDQTYGRRQP